MNEREQLELKAVLREVFPPDSMDGKRGTKGPVRIVGETFGGSADANVWTVSNSGAGSAGGIATAFATLSSGTANSGYGKLISVRNSRVIDGQDMRFRCVARITAEAVALCTRRVGLYTMLTVAPTNGYYFEVDPTGTLFCAYATGSSITLVASENWNGDRTVQRPGTTPHLYEIEVSILNVRYYVDGRLVHTVAATSAPLAATHVLTIGATASNSAAGVTSGTLEVWSAAVIALCSGVEPAPMSKYQAGTTAGLVIKIGPGNLRRLLISGVAGLAVITIYDNTAASGTVLWASGVLALATTLSSLDFGSVPFETGLTLVIATAAANVVVFYD